LPDFIPISYSRIATFKQCPKKLNEMSIAKTVPYVQSDAMRQGEIVHKMLEARVAHGTAFPHGYEHLEPIAASIVRAPGQTFAELALTFDRDLQSCGAREWDKAWLRVSVDVAKIYASIAWAGDYKTGNRNFDELQLKIYAAALFQAFPDLETVSTSYIWLKEKHLDEPTRYSRSDAPGIWNEIFEYSKRIEEARRKNEWPATPNRFCKWCAVLKAGRCEEGQRSLRR